MASWINTIKIIRFCKNGFTTGPMSNYALHVTWIVLEADNSFYEVMEYY